MKWLNFFSPLFSCDLPIKMTILVLVKNLNMACFKEVIIVKKNIDKDYLMSLVLEERMQTLWTAIFNPRWDDDVRCYTS